LILESSALAGVADKGESVQIVNGYPVVAAFLNGEGPFRMMVDTGTVRCSVRPSVAVRAGLHPSGTVLLATLVGEKTVPTARGSVRVGLREVLGAEVVINELPSLDGLESRVDGLVAQNFLSLAPYLLDYRARRLWLGDAAVQKADRLAVSTHVDFLAGRPILPVAIDFKGQPVRLILDSGVNDLVLRCGSRCGPLLDEHVASAVTNAGRMDVQKGRLPVAILGREKFFRMKAVFTRQRADPNNADGAVPLIWFSAVYVHPDGVIRWTR
jgi:hypothetical protein